MARISYTGVDEARGTLPELLDQAQKGHTTVITRRGRSVAALVPLETYDSATGQHGLLSLEGSGRGLWGRHSGRNLSKLRSEWSR